MKINRVVFMSVLAMAIAALAVPLIGLRAAASVSGAPASIAAAKARTVDASASAVTQQKEKQIDTERGVTLDPTPGRFSAETMRALGLAKAADPKAASARIAAKLLGKKGSKSGDVSIQSGQPLNLNSKSALSDALITAIGGRDNQFSEVTLIADWDGREDCAADREQKIDDFSFAESEIDQSLTRVAVSEHTVANGFAENVYYYGDSVGNFWIGTDLNPGIGAGPQVDTLRQVNIPTLLTTGISGG